VFRTSDSGSGSGGFALCFGGRHGCRVADRKETMGRVIGVERARGFDGVVGLLRALPSIEAAGRSI
jgi:hypothetical protein